MELRERPELVEPPEPTVRLGPPERPGLVETLTSFVATGYASRLKKVAGLVPATAAAATSRSA